MDNKPVIRHCGGIPLEWCQKSSSFTLPKFNCSPRSLPVSQASFFSGLCETSGVFLPKVVLFDFLFLFLFLGGACVGGRSEVPSTAPQTKNYINGETGWKYDTTEWSCWLWSSCHTWSKNACLSSTQIYTWVHEKSRLSFHRTGCFIGILIMAYYNPNIPG